MIVPMKHLTLLCVAPEREKALEELRGLGFVHLNIELPETGLFKEARARLARARTALQIIDDAVKGKLIRAVNVGALAPPCSSPDIEVRLRAPLPAFDADCPETCIETIHQLHSLQQQMVDELERLTRDIGWYQPFGEFDITLPVRLAEQGTEVKLFKAPINTTFNETAGVLVHELCADRAVVYGVMIGSGDLPPECIEVELPSVPLVTLRTHHTAVAARIKEIAASVRRMESQRVALEREIARLSELAEFAAAIDTMHANEAVAWLTGWMPAESGEALLQTARRNAWGVLLRDPQPEETPPTLLRPPRLFRPVLALFQALGISPAYNEADISIPFFCFFSIFFAMLVGDGGYGTLLLILTLLARRKYKSAPIAPFILMACFSCATIIWGTLSNTWFGAHPSFADNPVSLWLNDADKGMNNMMLVCFTLGVAHLSVARLSNALALAPDTKALAQLGWVGVVWFMYCMACDIVGIFKTPAFMFPLAGVSLMLIFLFTLKRHELRTQGIELGMLPLNIVSALGDIISYVRLFAVSLASVKVAENFNDMAINNGLPLWARIVPMVAILLVGHGLNMAMAALSILVHAVRLNTLEFSNHKGISWAGYAFNPFQRKTENS